MSLSKTANPPDISFPTEIVLPNDTCEVMRVQEAIVRHLEANCFSEKDIFGIKLALEEALVNAMKHGNQYDRSKKIRIAFHIHQEAFYIRIRDEGPGFDPTDVPDPTLEENLERSCGRGLMLMKYYMNEVHYLERGNVCLMCKRRNGTP